MVDPTTRTVPILAETPNPDDMFKLGMFVRIVARQRDQRGAADRPHRGRRRDRGPEGRLPPRTAQRDKDGHSYTFHPVKLGREAGDRQVVVSGLEQGEPVVSTGAFFLKSELILQNETEED